MSYSQYAFKARQIGKGLIAGGFKIIFAGDIAARKIDLSTFCTQDIGMNVTPVKSHLEPEHLSFGMRAWCKIGEQVIKTRSTLGFEKSGQPHIICSSAGSGKPPERQVCPTNSPVRVDDDKQPIDGVEEILQRLVIELCLVWPEGIFHPNALQCLVYCYQMRIAPLGTHLCSSIQLNQSG